MQRSTLSGTVRAASMLCHVPRWLHGVSIVTMRFVKGVVGTLIKSTCRYVIKALHLQSSFGSNVTTVSYVRALEAMM